LEYGLTGIGSLRGKITQFTNPWFVGAKSMQ